MSNLISTSSIASGSIIYPEHVLRSIQALRGETDTLFILSGSLVVSASDVRYPSLLYNPTPSAFIAYNTSSGNFYWTTNPNSISPSAYVATGSVNGNVLTFTKGDNTTFNLTLSATASSATSLVTASILSNILTFTKGDTSTFDITLPTTAISASYALTASYALNGGAANTGSLLTTASTSGTTLTFTKGDNSTFNVNIVSSSYASSSTSASQAISSSYATNASSSLYALTASYALNGGGGAAFPYTGSAEISGSLKVSNEQPFQVTNVDIASDYASQLRFYLGGSQNASIFSSNPGQLTLSSNDTRISNATIQGVVTGSLLGTASWALNASQSVSSSYSTFASSSLLSLSASQAVSSSFATNASSSLWAVSSSIAISASQSTSSSFATNASSSLWAVSASRALSASQSTSSSFATNASSSLYALTASYALNGGGGNAFPYTGSALITGSLVITGSLNATTGITGSLFGTASWALSASQAVSSSYALNASSSLRAISSSYALSASQTISSSYALTASSAPLYLPLSGGTINGNLNINGTASIAFLNVTYESSSVIYSSGSNQFGDALNDTQTLMGTVIVSGSQQITGSLNVNGGITGSLLGTASNATSASYAVTASYALNAGIPTGVPKIYQVVVNMTGGNIDTGGTPIASVLGPNGENKSALEALGWSFTATTNQRLTVGRPTGSQIQPLINIMTHAVNGVNVYSKAPTGQATGTFTAAQVLSSGNFTTLDVYGFTSGNTGAASPAATTITVTFGLIS
jgi:hypothetical protein